MANKRSILDQIMGSEEQDEPIIPQTEKEVIAKQAALEAEATSPGSGEGWRRISTGETELPTPANLANFKEEKSPMGMAESLKARSEIEDTSVPTYFPEDEGGESTSRQLAKQSATSLPGTTKDKLDVTKALEGTAKEKRSVMDAYQDALARRGGMQLVSDIGKASAQIGAGLAGGVGPGMSIAAPKMDTSIYDSIKQRAEDSIKDFAVEKQLKDEEALKDPNSPYSNLMRQVIEKLDPKLKGKLDGLPGHEADKILASLVKVKGIEEGAANRKLAQGNLEAQREFMRSMALNKFNELQNERTNKQIDNFVKYIDPTQKAGGAFAGYQKVIDASNRLKPLLYTDSGEIANPNKQMMEEIAIAVNTLIAGQGGSRSRSQIEALLPNTFKGKLNDFLEYAKNEPTGRDQQEFVKQFAKLVNREAKVANSSILKEIDKRAQSIRPRIRDKDTFDQAVELRKAEYSLPTQEPTKQKEQITLPKGHTLSPGKRFQEKSSGKTFKVNEDGQTASEI